MQAAESHEHVETQPFRAIFAAYDKVLPNYDIDPAHDQTYLRFLFKLGDKRLSNETLFQSFERFLEELGIQIEFNADEEVVLESSRDDQQDNGTNISHTPARRSRRASFNSIHDAGDESTRAIRSRADSRASTSRLYTSEHAIRETRPSTRATTRPTEKTCSNVSPSRKPAVRALRGRLTAEEFAGNVQETQRRSPSALSTARRNLRKTIKSETKTPLSSNAATSTNDLSLSAGSTSYVSSDASQAKVPPRQLNAGAPLHLPTRTQLLRDADTFHHYRIHSIARDIVDKWCDAAFQAKTHNEHLQRIAQAHDTEILLRQAFEHWRARLHARKQTAETKRFFGRLELRAVKARNLYLLTKAFTHWAQCAEDEIRESSLARQRVLGIKYFHAWRDITIENQNKVQHQGLKKFFGLWKQRYVRHLTHEINACLWYRKSLIKNGYWLWFWSFCERRAPEWHAGRIKQRAFLQWSNRYRASARRSQLVTQEEDMKTQRDIFSQWVAKARFCLSNDSQAVILSQRRTLSNALQTWSRSRRYAPFAQQVSNIVDWRVAGATFAVFVNRFRLEEQATRVSQLRVLRGSWTQWNDRLRWQTLARRIDDRYVLENLYRWVVAERCVLLRRLSVERLKGRCLQQWILGCSARRTRRDAILLVLKKKKALASLETFMRSWCIRYGEQQRAQQIAIDYYAPKVTHKATELWKGAISRTQHMETWAIDARFFFLVKPKIKQWREAASESKRQKRRAAYVQVRRNSKMTTATGVLNHWRNAAAHIREIHREAANADQQRLLRVGTLLFDHWKTAFDLSLDQGLDATEQYEEHLLQRLMRLWADHARHLGQMEETAITMSELLVQKTAVVALRRFRLWMIEYRGQEGKAVGLCLNYQRRHHRILLRRWRDKTAVHQNRPMQPSTFSARSRKTKNTVEDDQLGVTRRAEDWTEFDAGDWIPAIEADASSTPLPGYLSTPSKRAARAKALVQSTTPAGTPFQNRLRAQLNATPRSSRPGAFGRSTNLRGTTFGTILEDSPEMPKDS